MNGNSLEIVNPFAEREVNKTVKGNIICWT